MLGMGFLLMAGCASTGTRPVAPVDSGKPRPEPDRAPRPDEPLPPETTGPDISGGELDPVGRASDGYMPRHLVTNSADQIEAPLIDPDSIRQVAVLLPFSSENAAVRKEAEGLMEGIEFMMFESGLKNIVLMPLDTGGLPEQARTAAQNAVTMGADVVLGPLFNHNVQIVAQEVAAKNIPVMAFSSDMRSGGNGAYLVSLPLEAEIARVVDWASLNGVTQFAILGPANTYGRRVESAMRFEVAQRGGSFISAQFYSPSDQTPTVQAEMMAQTLREADTYFPGQVAVLIPEQGNRLRAVAPLLPYYDVDIKSVKVLGTGLWNSSEVWREPSLAGGVFAAPDPDRLGAFETKYAALHNEAPTKLASMGYDAALLAFSLLIDEQMNRQSIENANGFQGVNGLFRFNLDGSIDRGLAILEVTGKGGVRVIDPTPRSFNPDGS